MTNTNETKTRLERIEILESRVEALDAAVASVVGLLYSHIQQKTEAAAELAPEPVAALKPVEEVLP